MDPVDNTKPHYHKRPLVVPGEEDKMIHQEEKRRQPHRPLTSEEIRKHHRHTAHLASQMMPGDKKRKHKKSVKFAPRVKYTTQNGSIGSESLNDDEYRLNKQMLSRLRSHDKTHRQLRNLDFARLNQHQQDHYLMNQMGQQPIYGMHQPLGYPIMGPFDHRYL